MGQLELSRPQGGRDICLHRIRFQGARLSQLAYKRVQAFIEETFYKEGHPGVVRHARPPSSLEPQYSNEHPYVEKSIWIKRKSDLE